MDLMNVVKPYKAVIFDLGGVVIDLQYERTIEAFQDLGSENFPEIYSQAMQTDLFDRYETGNISSMHFVNLLKELLPQNLSPNEVVQAWNAMILDFQVSKLELLLELRKSHSIVLLSNTNDLHIDCVRRRLKKVSNLPLEAYFDKVYLSHEMGLRKPNPVIFDQVCSDMNYIASETLFIDDSVQHIKGAQSIGLNTFLFPQNESFLV